MEDKQIVKKIKQLKMIKPSQEWVVLTKKQIMGDGEEKGFGFKWLFAPIKRPVLVWGFRMAMAAMVLLAGSLLYMYSLSSRTAQNFLSDISSLFQEDEKSRLVSNSLEEVQKSLEEINLSLANLKNLADRKEALTMTEVIKGTASRGEEAIKNLKKKNAPSKQVLASLQKIEDNFKALKEESGNLQKEMIEASLEDLSQRTLSEENKERLAKAKESFSRGDLSTALVLIIKITE